jgi:rod shape-determining protein MreC
MNSFYNKKNIMVTAIAVIIALTTIISVNVFENSGPATGLANIITRPFMRLTSTIARTFESIYGNIYRYEQLRRDHERLQIDLARLRELYTETIQLEEENALLRNINNFRERIPPHDMDFAQIDDLGSSNWASTFAIELGSNSSNIATGNSVVTEYGALIGRVTNVGLNTSTVTTILDTTFSASVFIGETGETATATGDFAYMNQGLLILDNISDETHVIPGDTITTTGAGGIFPTGLVIGQVVEIFNHATGVGRYATIRPILPIYSISHAFVITDFIDVSQ